jgi:hypothetical protein
VIHLEFDVDGLEEALAAVPARLEVRLPHGLDLTLDEIAARARQTTTYVDRTSALRNSTQNAGVTGSASTELVGIVSFAARGKRGYLYGLAQEFGTRKGVKEKRFIRDAIDAQDGAQLEASLGAAFRDCGFEVA